MGGGVELSRLTDNRIGGTRTPACIPLILLGSVGFWQAIGGHWVAGTPEVFLLVTFLCMMAKAAVLRGNRGRASRVRWPTRLSPITNLLMLSVPSGGWHNCVQCNNGAGGAYYVSCTGALGGNVCCIWGCRLGLWRQAPQR